MLKKDLPITTLLYLVLAAVIIGSLVAYLITKTSRQEQAADLRPGLTETQVISPLAPDNSAETLPSNNKSTQAPEPTENGERLCVQIITPAKDPVTGRTEEFPTPCDVPEGWEIINN